jgi:putative transcriptional regulator
MNSMTKKYIPTDISPIGREVLEGLHETLDFLQGKKTGGNVVFMYNGEPINIKELRKNLHMTLDEFAIAYGFKSRTVENWELGLRQPPEHVLAYLQVITQNPKHVYNVLHGDDSQP